jgi:hypothetical protein
VSANDGGGIGLVPDAEHLAVGARSHYMRRQDAGVRCRLELRSPSNGTGWSETWTFSGSDERLLRDCLCELDEFTTEPPLEVWDSHAFRRVIRTGDRWRAAMLLWPDEPRARTAVAFDDQADAAWTAYGALRLADVLPERLNDLRNALRARFSAFSSESAS